MTERLSPAQSVRPPLARSRRIGAGCVSGLVVDPCADQVDAFVVGVVDDDFPVGAVRRDDVADPRRFFVVASREGIRRPVDGDRVDDHGGESTA